MSGHTGSLSWGQGDRACVSVSSSQVGTPGHVRESEAEIMSTFEMRFEGEVMEKEAEEMCEQGG